MAGSDDTKAQERADVPNDENANGDDDTERKVTAELRSHDPEASALAGPQPKRRKRSPTQPVREHSFFFRDTWSPLAAPMSSRLLTPHGSFP